VAHAAMGVQHEHFDVLLTTQAGQG
jgi:hypothetical protein